MLIDDITSPSRPHRQHGKSGQCWDKGGIRRFPRTLAREHARDNLRFNVVRPGLTQTPLVEEMQQQASGSRVLGLME